jgi:hypothetical protein
MDRWTRFFSEPAAPEAAFSVGRSHLCGIRVSRKERRASAHVIRPLPPRTVVPGFDRPNISNPAALEAALADAQRRLESGPASASLLIPETAVKTALLAFDALPDAAEEREAVLRWRLAKTLPMKTSDLRLAFDVVKSNGGARAFCVLALESVIREYEDAFAKTGLRVRAVELPTPHLLGLVPPSAPAEILIVNVEDDTLSLLAVDGGGPALFRVKSIAPGGPEVGPWPFIGTEVANTVHFLEDREKVRVQSVWIRDAGEGPPAALDVLEKRAGCPVRRLAFDVPAVAGPREQALLAPLIGQVS